MRPIRQCTEQRQHKNGQHVVNGHNGVGRQGSQAENVSKT